MAGVDDIFGGGGFGEDDAQKKNKPAQMYGQGHWNMGEQGAAGAWSGGYNPQWETDQQQSGGGSFAAPPASASPQGPSVDFSTPWSGGTPDGRAGRPAGWNDTMESLSNPNAPDPSGNRTWAADPRSNPNNTMSMYENPDTKQRYYDFDNADLQANPGGTFVEKNAMSTWDPSAIYTDPTSQFYDPGAADAFALSQPELAGEVARSKGMSPDSWEQHVADLRRRAGGL